jgi:hypothetical protein
VEHISVLELLFNLSNDDKEKKLLEFISKLDHIDDECQFNEFIEEFLGRDV